MNTQGDRDPNSKDLTRYKELTSYRGDRNPDNEDFEKYKTLTSYQDRINYLFSENILVKGIYSKGEVTIDLQPTNGEEKELFTDILLKQLDAFFPEYSFNNMREDLHRRLKQVPRTIHFKTLEEELRSIDEKAKQPTMYNSYNAYIRGKEPEFHKEKWFKDIIAHQMLYYENHVRELIEQLSKNGTIETDSEVSKQKITWKGELKEFAELIDQLQKNGWIDINDGQLKATVESICKIFDFSKTKRTIDSNTVASLNQYLKISERPDKIYTKRYTSKFSAISPNLNSKRVTK